MDQYAHPQHMETVTCLSYIWQGSWNNSEWVYSLNHWIMLSIVTSGDPRFTAEEDFLDQGSNVQW